MTRIPDRFSWNSAFTLEIASRACAYARADRRRNHTVRKISGGMIVSTASVSCGLMMNSAISTPTNVSALTNALMRPLCNRFDSVSTSVVMRVITRPAISRS